jgi:hypothetical protein
MERLDNVVDISQMHSRAVREQTQRRGQWAKRMAIFLTDKLGYELKIYLEWDNILNTNEVQQWLNNADLLINMHIDAIVDDLYTQIAEKYPNRDIWIEASKFLEVGLFVEYNCTRPLNSVTN